MTLRRSVFASVIGTYGVFIIQIATSMVLSRLLTPAEIGVWSVAQAAIFLSSTLRDFGAGDYLVRSGEITRRSIGQVFAVMLSISLFCAAVLWFGRGAIAVFFHEPRLVGLIGVATLTYLLMPFGLGALVTMERELAFATVHLQAFVGVVVGGCTAIFLAWRGFSFYSLAWGQFVQMATVLVLRTLARPGAVFCPPVFSGLKSIFHFGIFTTINAAIGQISTQSVTAILGRMLGFAPLGLYDRSQSMSNYVSTGLTFPIMQVVYVGFVRVKDKPFELGQLFLATMENLTCVLWPAYALLALLAPHLFFVLFGAQWVAAAPLFRLICAASLVITAVGAMARLLIALGRVQTVTSIEGPMMLLRIAAVLLLVRYGVWYAVLGVILPNIASAPFYARAIWPCMQMKRRELIRTAVFPVALMVFTVAPPALVSVTHLLRALPPVPQLGALLALGGMGWLLGVMLCGPRLKAELIAIFDHAVCRFRPLAPAVPASGRAGISAHET